jgi:hypothetical protein
VSAPVGEHVADIALAGREGPPVRVGGRKRGELRLGSRTLGPAAAASKHRGKLEQHAYPDSTDELIVGGNLVPAPGLIGLE